MPHKKGTHVTSKFILAGLVTTFILSCKTRANESQVSGHEDSNSNNATTSAPDWSENFSMPPGGDRSNLYGLNPEESKDVITKGRLHAMHYPVEPTGLLIPWNATEKLLTGEGQNLLRRLIGSAAREFSGFSSMDDATRWIGLYKYPPKQDQGANPYDVPYPTGESVPSFRMGVTLTEKSQGLGATFSCATCHAGNLFGRRVLGMTNRFPRSNEFFTKAKKVLPLVSPLNFQIITGATNGEREMYRRTVNNLKWVQPKKPAVMGLDTSLAQVSLSLATRELGPYAEKTDTSAAHPRDNLMSRFVADSKPSVWWNLKYKTRWLSDGSIVSGNPIFTNFLWNEIGRGVDLHELEVWVTENKIIEREVTAAVFATEAPRWTDFFDAETVDLRKAKTGEGIFNSSCASCHGRYEKAWSGSPADAHSTTELLTTTKVFYHAKTPVINVGTDGNRATGMVAFADRLNDLKISKSMGTRVQPQSGYVPPPLVGIWARWPYLHNNSVPSLCALLTKSENRPKTFWMGDANNRDTDYDKTCVGYPTGGRVPEAWKQTDYLYDTSKPGMTNKGHDRGVFLNDDGSERLSPEDKGAIIEFLKTL